MGFELEIIKSLQTITSPVFEGFMRVISILSNYAGFIFIFLLFFLFINKKYAIFFGLTYCISIGINYAIKYIVSRPRPYIVDSSILNIMAGNGLAMPSGHTVSATIISCFCLFLIYKLCKKNWIKVLSSIGLVLFIGLVILSRMYLGQHYLTDTLAGFGEGIIFACIGLFTYIKYESRLQEKENNTKETKETKSKNNIKVTHNNKQNKNTDSQIDK